MAVVLLGTAAGRAERVSEFGREEGGMPKIRVVERSRAQWYISRCPIVLHCGDGGRTGRTGWFQGSVQYRVRSRTYDMSTSVKVGLSVGADGSHGYVDMLRRRNQQWWSCGFEALGIC